MSSSALVEDDVNPLEYYNNRKHDLAEYYTTTGEKPYPNHFKPTTSLSHFIRKYDSLIKTGEHLKTPEDSNIFVAGRIDSIRSSGKKLFFLDIIEGISKIQIMARLNEYSDPIDFALTMKVLRRGDIIGAIGYPIRTKLGELSIIPSKVILLSPCLHMLSKGILKDQEIRYRQRYLDLLINSKPREIFQVRTTIIKMIRTFLDSNGFQEVETPMMGLQAGGASAKPFKTHHNDLKLDMVLRIAPELYLKQLVIGGLDRVYEIGKNFRNEGIDLTHNPEFTSCEFYWAYSDYRQLMIVTRDIINSICDALHIKTLLIGDKSITIRIPEDVMYQELPMIATLESKLGVPFPKDLETEETRIWLSKLCSEKEIECPEPRTTPRLLDKMVGHIIEPFCIAPTFITDHPRIMSPLAKPKEDNPQLTERFELFIGGKEICNSFTELNDPEIQATTFKQQAMQKAAGDDEAADPDTNFVIALEHGLPPTAGWGIGIDRLVMLLTGQVNIKEVILFPAMRPIVKDDK